MLYRPKGAPVTERRTIQVDRETLQVLEHLKKAKGAKSYAEVVRILIRDS